MLKETWNDTWIEYFIKIFTESEMAYNTTIFFIFLVIFLGIYLALRNQSIKRIWILLGNLIFYAWSGWQALVIVMATACIVYFTTERMGRIYHQFECEKQQLSPKQQTKLLVQYKKRAKKYLITALILILAIWIFVKIGKLIEMESVETFTDVWQHKGIIVPLGISYYSLSAIGYMLEIYWRRVKPEHSLINLFTVMTYFPHIVQGPISKYDSLLKQIQNLPGIEYNRICQGLQLMLWGYLKKWLLQIA